MAARACVVTMARLLCAAWLGVATVSVTSTVAGMSSILQAIFSRSFTTLVVGQQGMNALHDSVALIFIAHCASMQLRYARPAAHGASFGKSRVLRGYHSRICTPCALFLAEVHILFPPFALVFCH